MNKLWLKNLQNLKNKLIKNKNQIQNQKQSNIKSLKHSQNKEILVITYIFIGLLVGVMGYVTYFIAVKGEDIINNTYNKRQDLLAKTVVRGEILSSDRQVLAKTIVNDDKTETRFYPFKNMYAHVIGRFLKGRTGIESSYNFKLLASNTNPIKKVINEIIGEKNIGDNIVTTLNTKLQETAYNALGNNKGAIVVIQPSTGKILAMVSKPDYDPNNIEAVWDAINIDSESSALINRATQGLYPPGSTFKIMTTLEYIREYDNYKNYAYTCSGKYISGDVVINCYNNSVHGDLDLKMSFAKSCNSSFTNIGNMLNSNSFAKLCNEFLFNQNLDINMIANKSSFVLNSQSNTEEKLHTAMGQGKTQITPLHNALISCAIANDGVLMKPYVVDKIENFNGTLVKKYKPSTYKKLMTEYEANYLTELMEEVIQSGTGTSLKDIGKVAGKTGSAEYETGKPAHAWFVGFMPSDEPEIVVSIIVEGVGTGSQYAVPIAKQIFDTYNSIRDIL